MNFVENETVQKLRGGYYTPMDLAHFLVRWVKQIQPQSILEPSCGDGGFFRVMGEVNGFQDVEVQGFELDKEEARKARKQASYSQLKKVNIISDDFLKWAIDSIALKDKLFDAVIGNPPFIRYQYLPEEFQKRSEEIFRLLNLRFTKHTNAWVPFILGSMALLRPGGRLAMVVPAEIIHVTHAQSLRTYLGKISSRLVIIDPEELWFPETLQGAVLLLAEKKNYSNQRSEGLGIYQVRGRKFLDQNPADVFNAPRAINGKTVEGKWTRALLNSQTLSLIDSLTEKPEISLFKDIAKVDVGIVTGANKFFLVTNDVVNRYDLSDWAHPMFGRSEHCPGVIYDEQQHKKNEDKGNPTNFIWFRDRNVERSHAASSYIRFGETQNLHQRYKCRVRDPWYSVPSVYSTEIGMLKRAHDAPRLILNKILAFTTDTAYRICCQKVAAEKLVYCFINGLTALSAELEGRHYGGGVLELVPSEIERLYIPLPQKIGIELERLDNDIRSKPMDDLICEQTKKILGGLGVSAGDQNLLVVAWQTLRDRRQRISVIEEE